jgi:hypothetical protein
MLVELNERIKKQKAIKPDGEIEIPVDELEKMVSVIDRAFVYWQRQFKLMGSPNVTPETSFGQLGAALGALVGSK